MKSESFLYPVACVMLGLALANETSAQTTTDRLRASVTIASDYVQNGLLQTNDDPSLQLALDYEHENGFFLGGALSNVDYLADSGLSNSRESQGTLYAGYLWRRNQWRTNVAVSRYIYPDFERDYDYWYGSATVSYRDRYFVSAAYSSDYLDLYDRTKQVSAGLALPWIQDIEFSATIGHLGFGGRFASSYSYWNAGISRPFGRIAVDVRYHDSDFDRDSIAGNQTHNQWVISMTWSPLPR